MREVLKKYLIIACVSLIEESLTRLARKTIEDKNIPISAFGSEISKEFIQWVMRGGKASIGVFAATSYYLGSPKGIDRLFSCIFNSDSRFANLNLTFFEADIFS
jgi:hypothetical protein